MAKSALLIGISKYTNPLLSELRATSTDLTELAGVLSDPDIGAYEVKTLSDKQSHEITEEVSQFFHDAEHDDELLLYFSCHGVKHTDGQLYFAATNTKLGGPLTATAVAARYVADRMNESKCKRIVVLLDCCYSGAFARGMIPKAAVPEINLGETFPSEGHVILTASTAVEYAFEDSDPARATGIRSTAVFTRAVIDGLKTGDADLDRDGLVSVDDLYAYVSRAIFQSSHPQSPMRIVRHALGTLIIARTPRESLVLTVTGVKGGVGKGTLVWGLAHMMAEAGRAVVIVDLDLTSKGSTLAAARMGQDSPIKTVLHHLAPHAVPVPALPVAYEDGLWDVTPERFTKQGLGTIHVLPAVPAGWERSNYDALANIPGDKRDEVARLLVMELAARATTRPGTVVLFDSGAANNTLDIAAFSQAHQSLIIASTNVNYLRNVIAIRQESQRINPGRAVRLGAVIVNQVFTDKETKRVDWKTVPGLVGSIENFPELALDEQRQGSVDFDIQHTRFAGQLRGLTVAALKGQLAGTVGDLLPTPEHITVRPWWNLFVVDGRARSELDKLRHSAGRMLPALILLVLAGTIAISLWWPEAVEPDGTVPTPWPAERIGSLAGGVFAAVGLTGIYLLRLAKLRFLRALAGLSPQPRDRDRLVELLRARRGWQRIRDTGIAKWREGLLFDAVREENLAGSDRRPAQVMF